MAATDRNWLDLCDEHGRLLRECGRAQQHASDLLGAQARRIAELEAEVMRLRAVAMIRESALHWSADELRDLKAAIPGLPKRITLAEQVRVLEARIRALMRGERRYPRDPAPRAAPVQPGPERDERMADSGKVVMWVSREDMQTGASAMAALSRGVRIVHANRVDARRLDTGLADVDLVICQAGCVSHGDWWRVKDYCARTGKQCVLVEQPDALDRIVAAEAPSRVPTAR